MSKTLHATYCALLRETIAVLQERQYDLARSVRQAPAADNERRAEAKRCIEQADLSLAQSIRAAEEALHFLDLDAGRVNEDGEPTL